MKVVLCLMLVVATAVAQPGGYLRLVKLAYCTEDAAKKAEVAECLKAETETLTNVRNECATEVGGKKWDELNGDGCKEGSGIPDKLSQCMNKRALSLTPDEQALFDNIHICMFKPFY